ncbi:type II toxin-antitoxin system CcdA family antitoxin [Oryzicola mucosus]|uniref:Type II toxin-antitoxin system CcdA family antitoxin n=1 Tax=Oryzicola mucosus TaxID=2767425 RepID=A0A8J6PFM9_9HYPH|nr:type II toxin-antitoxin system CcdA family antitoxin [Oryzicola mucosus]MBD0414214.1 type II toxin-antitoxin system CcdA family antitoxin [Oryzicola mucosus]
MPGLQRAANKPSHSDLLNEARELGFDVSQVASSDLRQTIKAEKERRWKLENKEAIEETNAYFREHGLPLENYRQF